jgi:hypothetical protein
MSARLAGGALEVDAVIVGSGVTEERGSDMGSLAGALLYWDRYIYRTHTLYANGLTVSVTSDAAMRYE